MYQALIKKGKISAVEVPQPIVSSENILIKVMYSCISPGTELAGIKNSGQSLIRKAIEQPEKIKKAWEKIRTQGLRQTLDFIQTKFDGYSPVGYSVSGVVLGAGNHVAHFMRGDRVAAAGAGWANHAEFVEVPRNLVVKLPENVSFQEGATATLGSIALQGVRRANLQLGETVAVVGLGTIGQLTIQLAKACGCKVIGIDVVPTRLELATTGGANLVIQSTAENTLEKVLQYTNGYGADAVLFTAATNNPEVLSESFKLCRKKGRVVLVGIAGNEVRREDLYEKELDFLVSCSYGPGRYDANYEMKGIDYPYGYVRWTENRNIGAYLDLLSEKRIQLNHLIHSVYPILKVEEAYQALDSTQKPLMVLLEYNQTLPQADSIPERTITCRPSIKSSNAKIRIGIIGAGQFAANIHLPNLKKLSDKFHIQALSGRTASGIKNLAERYNVGYFTNEYQQILADKDIDAVMICTRHHQHASMTLEALKAGKHVFVEKPLALTQEELNDIGEYIEGAERRNHALPLLQTGFNRRFSPLIQKIMESTHRRLNPMIINYRMNAGYLPLSHWVHQSEGGGRNIGEACHLYDLFTFLTQSQAISITATSIRPKTDYYVPNDNFVTTINFADGSVANLTYTAMGNESFPKEQMEIFSEGLVYSLNDYRLLSITGAKGKAGEKLIRQSKLADKGHYEELIAFYDTIHNSTPWPIPFWQQMQAMEIAFAVETLINTPSIEGEGHNV
jgi:predicted dehydrogenase/threonine dehydrogenase-like Zn-dependent dehydrogenase